MKKKLYRVRVILFVMAENELDACAAATRARFGIFECAARKTVNVDPGWNDAIPFLMKLPSYVEAGIRAFDIDNRSSIQPGG